MKDKFDFNNIRITNMDYDGNDYPDFCDSCIVEAEYIDTGKELTEEEVDNLNENHHDFVLDSVWDYIH